MKRMALWLVILFASANLVHAQSSAQFSGFLTRQTVYDWSESRNEPNMYGFIRHDGSVSESRRETITVSQGKAHGRLAYEKREETTVTTQITGGCADGTSGTSVTVDGTRTIKSAVAAGPATCEAYFDEFGGWADCFVNQEHEYTTLETTTHSTSSGCALIPSSSETSKDTHIRKEQFFGVSVSQEFEDGKAPAVMRGSHSELEASGERTMWTWMLVREDPEYELVVEPHPDYFADWRPAGGELETVRGNTLSVSATLRRKDGRELDMTAKRVRFQLSERSHEPGVAINAPWFLDTKQYEFPDLMFEPEFNEPLLLVVGGEYGAEAETIPGSYDVVYAVVSSFDWGAWGALTVEAELQDGRRIAGSLAHDPEQFELLIPRRQNRDDPIAAAWREQGPGRDGDARLDDEPGPEGNAHPGDGYSLYEEYRGFHVNGRWTEGDPLQKDLLIYNTVGEGGELGAELYARASGVRVHMLRDREMLFTQVNFNSSPRAKNHDQHGHFIQLQAYDREKSWAQWKPDKERIGPPGHYDSLMITSSLTDPVKMAPTVAHELGHGTNVDHHGEGDPWFHRYIVRNGTHRECPRGKTPEEAACEVVTFAQEDGTHVSSATLSPDFEAFVAVVGGQHSGAGDCYMRYRVAALLKRDLETVRYRLDGADETGEASFCTSGAGTGVNDPSRMPFSRYGDRQKGNCSSQVCVNDGHLH